MILHLALFFSIFINFRLTPTVQGKCKNAFGQTLCIAKLASNSRGIVATENALEERGNAKMHTLSP
jgi:hypothetical protein